VVAVMIFWRSEEARRTRRELFDSVEAGRGSEKGRHQHQGGEFFRCFDSMGSAEAEQGCCHRDQRWKRKPWTQEKRRKTISTYIQCAIWISDSLSIILDAGCGF